MLTTSTNNQTEPNPLAKELGEFYPFKSHYKNVNGHRMHYVDEGSGPVIIMVHGNPSWSIYWRKLVEELKSKYRVIAIDHIGCGLSDKPSDYNFTLEQRIEDAWNLVEQLELKQYSLFVHDWGGAIGMGLAEKAPANVQSLVVFNSAAFFSSNIPKRIAMCRWPVFGKLAIQGFNAFAGAAVHMATHKGFSKELRKAYVAPYNSFKNRRATFEFVQDIPMEAGHPTRPTLNKVEEGLSQFIDHPMLIIWGEKDWCFDISFLKTWKSKFPKATVLPLRDSGHYVVEDGFDDYIGSLKQFLRQSIPAASEPKN
ncbi:alpha/beta fold hydrolase [bacterium]|nr:alpha/beta fold hydrolase [bacterium]